MFRVKPLKNKPNLYQAFARVSIAVREGIEAFNNKLVLGLSPCKVYDQFHVKRCNICQNMAKCGENHDTRNCSSNVISCTNCKRTTNDIDDSKHEAES